MTRGGSGDALEGAAPLKRSNGEGAVMRGARETCDEGRNWGDRAAIRPAAHWLPSHQTHAPVRKSITLNWSQVKDRERIRQLKKLYRHAPLPAEKGLLARHFVERDPVGRMEMAWVYDEVATLLFPCASFI